MSRADDCLEQYHMHVGICQRAGYRNGLKDAADAIRGLHTPWYEVNGVRHEMTVVAYGPTAPAANARRIVRRGLYDAFPWLKGDPGPNPGDLTHALLIGGSLHTSADYAKRLCAITGPPGQSS